MLLISPCMTIDHSGATGTQGNNRHGRKKAAPFLRAAFWRSTCLAQAYLTDLYVLSPDSLRVLSMARPIFLVSVPLMKPRMVCFLCRHRHKKHSVRGFISGSLGKKMGLTVESFKRPDGVRAYRVAGQ
jgi:hypothetical protein